MPVTGDHKSLSVVILLNVSSTVLVSYFRNQTPPC